jgi:hypothetical protein
MVRVKLRERVVMTLVKGPGVIAIKSNAEIYSDLSLSHNAKSVEFPRSQITTVRGTANPNNNVGFPHRRIRLRTGDNPVKVSTVGTK